MTLRSSLRAKLTLALLAMSFAAIAVVGLTARQLMLARFNDLVSARAMQTFTTVVAQYYEKYGSFEAARAAEPFGRFLGTALNKNQGSPQAAQGAGDSTAAPGGAEGAFGPPPRVGPGGRALGPGGRPLPPPNGRGGRGGGNFRPDALSPFGGYAPQFLVVDSSGKVLLPYRQYAVGDAFDLASAKKVTPIESGGEVIALAVPMARPRMDALEERYLSSMRDSWLVALLLATALAIPMGLLLGSRFSTPVREITSAIRGMQGGELRQAVPVRSEDELGELSTAFNQMSVDLADAYQEIEESRSQLQEQASFMEELSRRDGLTHLLNRRAFDEGAELVFKQAYRYQRPLTLAMIDIDHFKRVNDGFSHAIGDAVLVEVANLLQGNIREIDVVARYGGEEFAICFPETPLEDARHLAERLRELVEHHDWNAIAPGLAVTLSVGLSPTLLGATFRDVLDAADAKLYEAKKGGRNRVCA